MALTLKDNYITKRLAPAVASTAVGPFVDAGQETGKGLANAGKSWRAEVKNIGSDIRANFNNAGFLRWRSIPRTVGTLGHRLMNGFSDALTSTLQAGTNVVSRITRRTSSNIFSLFNKNIPMTAIRGGQVSAPAPAAAIPPARAA